MNLDELEQVEKAATGGDETAEWLFRIAAAREVERVRELHVDSNDYQHGYPICAGCGDDYPCPTIRAIEEE